MRATVFFLVSFITSGLASAAVVPGTDIDSFLKCLNDNKAGKPIADAVECLPPKCVLTVTMNADSRQPACFAGACQLPRILLECRPKADPKKPPFHVEFSLCFKQRFRANSNIIPIEKIELGMEVASKDPKVNLEMAEIPMPFGGYKVTAVGDTLNKGDSKKCNTCHDAAFDSNNNNKPLVGPPHGGVDANRSWLAKPIEPAGENLKDNVICAGGKKTETKDEDLPEIENIKIKPQCLQDVCECLKNEIKNCSKEDQPRAKIALALCNALRDYENDKNRGVKR